MPSVEAFRRGVTQWGWLAVILGMLIIGFLDPFPQIQRGLNIFIGILAVCAVTARLTWEIAKRRRNKRMDDENP